MDEGLNSSPADRSLEIRARTSTSQHSPMPDQVLWHVRRKREGSSSRVYLARVGITLLWMLGTGAFAITLYRVLSVATPTPLQIVFLILSTLCFAWVAVGSASAIVGFVSLMTRDGVNTLSLEARHPDFLTRTALLFPVYREDPSHVCVTIDAMCQDLASCSASASFDVFILSDTQDHESRVGEERAFDELIAR